ncbi:MAG: caspase family protein [Verrucomicrobiia bacterium]
MHDYALVVGIEVYGSARVRDLQGPSLDALEFTLWLSETQGIPAGNIALFLNKAAWDIELGDRYSSVLGKVKARGIVIRDSPSRVAISEAFRTNLLSGSDEPGTLWLYWSGHGLTFPPSREALLCAGEELKEPSFIFLSEFRDALRSETYRRFSRQRLIIDACAEYLTPEELNLGSFRNPSTWAVTQAPEQIELDAVAVGSTAQAEPGGSLFTRVMLRELRARGWPSDLRDFHQALETAIRGETKDEARLPRMRIISPRFEAGIDTGTHADECRRLLEMLESCEIPFDAYQPFYLRTMGGLTSDVHVLSAPTLTAMVRELLQLAREAEFGDRSLGLVEFFERIWREFKGRAAPIETWLNQLPAGARLTVREKLDQESADLLLSFQLTESAGNQDGFPVALRADLTDATLSSSLLSWEISDIKDTEALETEARLILTASDAQARRQRGVNLHVQVFANPPLLGVPWHAFRVDPEDKIDEAVFGQLCTFVLRSRARLVRDRKYDLASWKRKALALRKRPCATISFAPAPEWSDAGKQELNDQLAQLEGLLLMSHPLAAPSAPTEGDYKVLTAALRRGVPLACWPVVLPGTQASAGARMADTLRGLFGQCASLAQTPAHFRDARKSEPWARQVALFWDDDDHEKYLILTGEEPRQI